jgi:hypothetical protein
MKFIEAEHPEGGRIAISVDHISSAQYRPSQGAGVKSRLTIDLDNSEQDVVLLGEEADRVWAALKELMR